MNPCNGCPLKLFNTKCHCLTGVGNPNYGKLIVVPNVDYDAYKNKGMTFSKYVEVINEVLSPSTGGIVDYYIVPLIRCKLDEKCPINDDIKTRCYYHTLREIEVHKLNKILLLGRATDILNIVTINDNINKIFIESNRLRGYSVNYSPFVKYIDDAKYKEFCNHLIKWYNANRNNNYDGFEIVVI